MLLRSSISLIAIVVLPLLISAKIDHVKEKASETHVDATHLKGKDAPEYVDHRKSFMENIKLRRMEHKNAIVSIKNIEKANLRKFLEDVHPGISKQLLETRQTFEKVRFEPTDPLPFDRKELKDALSKLIENIAFFSDLSLSFPKFFEPKMKKNQKLRTIMVWAFNFAKGLGLYDGETQTRVIEMAEHFEIIEKRPDSSISLEDAKKAAKEELARKKAEKTKEKKPSKKYAKGEL